LAGRLDKIPDYVPAGRLLDVGCGAGQYVAALRALGWRAVGLDIASRAAAILGRAEDLPLESAAFDVVTFWHSLEHTASPARALREAGRLLRPGGALLLEVPNLASIQARLCGRYWLHLDPPRHRYHLTPATLRAYLEGAGFAEIVVWSVPSAVGWTGSLQTRLNALTGRRLHGLLRSRLIAALLWPLAALEAALGAGGCLRARARRPA
jgi:SAM-dependent methyltransferase